MRDGESLEVSTVLETLDCFLSKSTSYMHIISSRARVAGRLIWACFSSKIPTLEKLMIDVYQRNPSNLKELEQFCLEEWAKIPVARCAKFIETHPKRLAAGMLHKVALQSIDFGGVNSYALSSFLFFCVISCLFHKKIYILHLQIGRRVV